MDRAATGRAARCRVRLLACAALALLALAVFGATCAFDFVPLDDRRYVLENPAVRAGLSARGVAWAFTSFHGANWHPLTWLSHQADVSLFGLRAGGHHATSLALHAAGAAVLFLALEALTGAAGRAALAAALFAVHPLHVESVAWVAERKDVLCGLFWGLALLAHGRYAARPSPGRRLAVAAAVAAALLSKATAVTLPLVLLLLDYWPLGRWRPRGTGRGPAPSAGWSVAALMAEKIPLFLLAAGAGAATLVAQSAGGALGSLAAYPLGLRAANASLSIAAYGLESLWPAKLAVFYPFPRVAPDAWKIAAAALVAAGCTAAALRARRAQPALTCGWLWYLAVLAPVLGLVQAGDQARADRYTYVPLTGLFVALVWGLGDVLRRARAASALGGAAGLCAIVLLGAASVRQSRTWADGVTLFTRGVEVVPGSYVTQTNLGGVLFDRGDLAGARRHLLEAIRLEPAAGEPRLLLSGVLLEAGDPQGARAALEEGLRLSPPLAERFRRDGSLAALERRISAALDAGARDRR